MSDLPCDEVKRSLNAFLDGEVEAADADVIRAHVAACEPCMDDLEVRAALRRILQRCCCAVRAPETLRARVVTQITVSRSWYWQI
ncbi:mycothiol system anti-sigma-R factor [Propionicicella superfundia]|uniref:mycothiol system anti-sigma-R factor n=1 Tax=Propionicicella superfundia TaxID=348582 RepID=UPI00040802A0|nr:mycothiol system anti-sigma-R factor [Propionicicella superfundia]